MTELPALNQRIHKFTADVLGFMSDNRLTVTHDRKSRIQQNLFEKFVKTYQYFFLILKTV